MVDLSAHNVVFVTADSCRYDTFAEASLPFLKSIGSCLPALTHGTYTLPAHLSFFMGYLPTVLGPPFSDYYSPHAKQLWRLSSGRHRDPPSVALSLDGTSILDGYRQLGFKTIGAGGVRWFRHPLLQSFFDRFLFYASTDLHSVFEPRARSEFPLNHADELIAATAPGRFFLFINCQETHCPYDVGQDYYDPDLLETIRAAQPLWGFKANHEHLGRVLAPRIARLKQAQVLALETIDRRLDSLVARLPKPFLLVFCGDHGECFGEDGQWGHGYAHPTVLQVPLLIAVVD